MLRAGTALLLACVAGALQARQVDLASLSLEDLLDIEIVTASRFPQQISRAPSAIQVIGADEIRAHGWRTLAEALDSLPGLYLADSGLYTYLGTRGLLRAGDYNTRFLVLVNGHRLNDAVYSQGPVGAELPLDMSLVERIEYAPGPGSAVYGSNAFFGVINVLTREAAAFGNGQLGVGVAGMGTTDIRVTLPLAIGNGNGNGDGHTLLSARHYHSRGRDLYFPEFADTPSGGHVRGQDDERVRQLFLQHRSGSLALQVLAGERRKEDPVAPYMQTFAVPGAQVQDRWIAVGAQYRQPMGDRSEATWRMDLVESRYLGDYVYDGDVPLRNRDHASGRMLLLGAQSVTRFSDRHTMVAGAELHLGDDIDQRNFDLDPYAVYLDSRESMASWGAFVDNQVQLGDVWQFNGGLRLDRSDRGELRASPRMALMATWPRERSLKLIAGESYRSPNAYERYYEVDTGEDAQLANPSLGAEHMRTAELHYATSVGARTRASLNVYHYRLRDLITLVTTAEGNLTLTNVGRASTRGAELAVVHQRQGGLRLGASYALAEVEDSETERPANAPRGVAKVLATIPLAEGLKLAVDARRVSRRASLAAEVPAYAVVDANLHWVPTAGPVSWSLGVANLFDRRYEDPVGPEFMQDTVPRRGRQYRLEATWQF